MTTTTNTIVITLAASITDNKIDSAIVEKVEIKSGAEQTTTTNIKTPLTEAEKSKSLEFIWVDFKDGRGFQLLSINDSRIYGFFIPSYKIGANIKPAMGGKFIRSGRQVRGYRVSGLALVKCE